MAKSWLVRPRTVTGDGEGLVLRGGLVWLGEVADRSGLSAGLSEVLVDVPEAPPRPGRVTEYPTGGALATMWLDTEFVSAHRYRHAGVSKSIAAFSTSP